MDKKKNLMPRHKWRLILLQKENDAIKNKIRNLQNHIEDLYTRIRFLEEIEDKYRLLQSFKPEAKEAPVEKTDVLNKIKELREKVRNLRIANYNLRRTQEEETAQEKNSISYFEHRMRVAVTKQIIERLKSIQQFDPRILNRFTSKELAEINNAETAVLARFLKEAETYDVLREGISETLKNYQRDIEQEHIIKTHKLTDEDMLARLDLLSTTAMKLMNMLPLKIQKELLSLLKHNDDRLWNGSFIKGYYFLYEILEYSSHKKYLLKDMEFSTEDKDKKVNVLFKETLYEIFGSFTYLENNRFYIIEGLRDMAAVLKNPGQLSDINGVFGELVAAYFYQKAYGMKIVQFHTRVDTRHGSESEIDLLAIDKDNILWDIEVKNWKINTLRSAHSMTHKIKKQMDNSYRKQLISSLKPNIEKEHALVISGIRQRAILVSDSNFNSYLRELIQGSHVILDIADLVPAWLTKGVYDPE